MLLERLLACTYIIIQSLQVVRVGEWIRKSTVTTEYDKKPFPDMEFLNNILVEVSGHKLDSSQTRLYVWFSTLIFHFTKCFSLIDSSFADFLSGFFKPERIMVLLKILQ